MVKLKDVATIQTGVYLKSTPLPDTCYLQVNDFDEEGYIRPTVRPTTTVSSKAARHLLTESDLLLAAKGGKNFCAIAPTQLSKADLEEFDVPLPPLERQRVCIALTRLHRREQALYKAIAERRRQITDCKLTKIYKDER